VNPILKTNLSTGILNIISTPIGNYADMTFRGLRMLNESDYVICEEYKEATRLLKFFDIKKDLKQINEHNEEELDDEIIYDLLAGKNVSLISDCGTPLFADPGNNLLNRCIELNLKVDFIPGANSLLAAIMMSGFDISRFLYYGFLSPKTEIRKSELKTIKNFEKVIAIFEAPYRLRQVLEDIKEFMPERDLFIGVNLTTPTEMQLRGNASEILNSLEEKFKGEFVIIINKPLS
jgi:16S rRNA (cytidine1402-2'-O)-methyltransferase